LSVVTVPVQSSASTAESDPQRVKVVSLKQLTTYWRRWSFQTGSHMFQKIPLYLQFVTFVFTFR